MKNTLPSPGGAEPNLHAGALNLLAARGQLRARSECSFFSEDAVYNNGPLEPVKGREAIQATLAAFMAMGGQVGVDITHIVADGPIVMTERVDHFIVAGKTISLPVMGIFEVHDGVITAWRDYFDLNQFTVAAARRSLSIRHRPLRTASPATTKTLRHRSPNACSNSSTTIE